MNILHVVPTYLPATRYGGPIYSVHALCAAQARLGHRVQVFTTNVDGPGVSPVTVGTPVDVDGVSVTYFDVGVGRRLYRSPSMGRALQNVIAGFHVVHAHSVFLWPTTAAARYAERADIPYVISPRGMLVEDLIRRKSRVLKSGWIRLFERRNLARAATIHLTSDVEAEELRRLRLPTRRIDVIGNGVDLPPVTSKNISNQNWSERAAPIVLSVGRLNWKKGLDRLIQSMEFLPTARLLIAGNDEDGYQRDLEALTRKLGLEHRVQFLGPVHGARKWELFASADVFALPSYSENFGNVVLEAMACGVPVVITPEVGLAPRVLAGGAGLVVPGEPESFGRAIAELLESPARRAEMGARGKSLAERDFSWEAIARKMITAYSEISSGATAPPDIGPR